MDLAEEIFVREQGPGPSSSVKAAQSPNRLRKNWKAIFPFGVMGVAWIDPDGTMAGLRMLKAAANESKLPFTSTSGLADPPRRNEALPCTSTSSVTVSASVLNAQA